MRTINTIIIHCTYTPTNMDVDVDTIRDWHVNERGWSDIGYHFLIRRDGEIEDGRPVEKAGAHARGHNSTSIGVALAGGMSKNDKPEFNFTWAQMLSLDALLSDLQGKHDITRVIGHNQVSSKDCPCFNVEAFVDQ